MNLINSQLPAFKAHAYHQGKFIEVTDQSLQGRWAVLVFYPADFTFVCPTELEDLAKHQADFDRLNTDIYAVSCDTHFAHKAWHDTSPAIGKIGYAMIGDPTGHLARALGVMIEDEGMALRGTFLVNPEGRIKTCEIHDNSIGRDARELIRKIEAAQFVAAHPGDVCPARWREGEATLKPSPELVGKL